MPAHGVDSGVEVRDGIQPTNKQLPCAVLGQTVATCTCTGTGGTGTKSSRFLPGAATVPGSSSNVLHAYLLIVVEHTVL